MSEPLKIFITYAHKDKAAKNELKTRLAVMEQQDEIKIWHDNEILPGDTWREAIFNNLAESDILLYLVSAASLASKNCNKELSEAIKNTKKNITIIPIILEDCDWQHHRQLSKLQALPDSGKPINEWQPESKGWQSVVEGIRKVVKDIVDSRGKVTSDQQDAKEQLADLLSMGNFRMMLGQVEIAVENYSYAIKLQPNFAEAYNNRGNAYSDKGDFGQAIQDYSKAIELKPDLAEAYYNRGVAYGNKRNFDRAIQDFNEAIKLKPDLAEAYNIRGMAYSDKGDKGDFDQAIQDYNKAVELKPNYAEAYHNRGIAYGNKRNFDQAIQDYSKAIELKPNYAEAYNNRGVAYGNKDNLDQAIQDYNEAIKLKPDYPEAYNNRGIAYNAN